MVKDLHLVAGQHLETIEVAHNVLEVIEDRDLHGSNCALCPLSEQEALLS
jgi:hypothetical protein